jgi:transposase
MMMPTKRLSMKKLREILRLKLEAKLSIRAIQPILLISIGAIQKVVSRATALELTWDKVQLLDEQQLTLLFYANKASLPGTLYTLPDWHEVRLELSRKGMTKQLLWEEYVQANPSSHYSYSRYCRHYSAWLKKQKRSMRQVHKAGEKLFVDYAGQTVPIVNSSTGEVYGAQVFVAVLGASNYIFAEATRSQKLIDWTGSHVRAFEFFGGVTELIIPDNLRSGVSQACRYDPDLNSSYQQLAAHYSTVIIPARPRKPKDKSKAEIGVQIIERWILARLRYHTFFSLREVNNCIQSLLEEVNNKPYQKLKGTRKEWFESIDKPVLSPLPALPYEYTEIKPVKVNIDYHVQFDKHCYSVPHHLVGERIEVHAKANIVAFYFYNKRVASHVRKYHPGMTTIPEHMPERHQKHHQWTPERLMNWAQSIGDEVLIWVQALLVQKDHPEQAYRVCLGLLNLSKSFDDNRLNKACFIANEKKLYRLKQVQNILASNQDKVIKIEAKELPLISQDHENIRGPKSFH